MSYTISETLNYGSLENDTIAAIATPVGQAGIGIVRVSGPLCREIAQKVFRPKKPTSFLESHRLYLGDFCDPSSGQLIDEVLVSHMKSPYSYTREDVLEINSHSGYVLLSKILQIVLDQGARLAKPGEFTLRAYLNGRIDLTQAEAVMDLIHSKSEKGLRLAAEQIKGAFRDKMERLRERLVDLLGRVELAIDFPDEDIPEASRDGLSRELKNDLLEPIDKIIHAYRESRLWVDGVKTVIVGRVNAGKSSLLNRLLNEERAIVTPVPGTTRDVIESVITVKGLPLRLMDTAGLRSLSDAVEEIGIRMTEKKLAEADLPLVVVDQSRPLNQDDLGVISKARQKEGVIVLNKIDLPPGLAQDSCKGLFAGLPVVKISALTGQGIDRLKETLFRQVLEKVGHSADSHIAPNLRHKKALEEAAQAIKGADSALAEDAPAEIVAFELKTALEALEEIVGAVPSDEVLNRIFAEFCIGK